MEKISIPEAEVIVPREHLYAMLDRTGPITWIQGHAGSGKSLTCAGYLRDRGHFAMWYRMDRDDADPANLFRYLSRARRELVEVTDEDLPMFSAEHRPAVRSFADRFFNAFYHGIEQPFWLVFDDYHFLPWGTPADEILASARASLPEHGRIVLLSRSDPPPNLVRLRVDGRLALIDQSHLNFTPDELRQLARRHEIEAGDALVQGIWQGTAGWAAGAVLMLQASALRDGWYDRWNRSEAVFDYFAQEVFDALPADMQAFLMRVAVLPSFSSELADAVAGTDRAAEWLGTLIRRGHFVTSTPGRHAVVYVLHALFREFLLQRLERTLGPEARASLTRRAADQLIDADRADDALPMLIEFGAWGRLADALLPLVPRLLAEGRHDTLAVWLGAVPASSRRERPWLSLWLGFARMATNLAAAREAFTQAYWAFRESGDSDGTLLAWTGVADSYFHEWGDFRQLDEWLDRLPPADVDVSDPEAESRVAAVVLLVSTMRRPDFGRTGPWIERAQGIVHDTERPSDQRVWVGLALMIHLSMYRGPRHTDPVAAAVGQLVETEPVRPITRITWRAAHASYLAWVGRYGEATIEVDHGRSEIRMHGVEYYEVMLATQGIIAAIGEGRLDDADEALDEVDRILVSERRIDAGHVQQLRSRVALERGDLEAARQLAWAAVGILEATGALLPIGLARCQLAWVVVAAGDREEAEAVLDQQPGGEDQWADRVTEFPCRLLRAFIDLERGSAHAHEHLHQAFATARDSGTQAPCLFHRPMLARLCAEALAADIERDYVTGLIGRMGLSPPPGHEWLESWPRPLQVYTMGGFRVVLDGEPLQFARKAQKRPLDLLMMIVASGAPAVDQQWLTDELWPDAEADAGARSLGTTLYRLRRLVGAEVVRRESGRLSLDADLCWVDVWTLTRELDQLQAALHDGDEERLAGTVSGLLDRYDAPFLDGVEEPWARMLRSRMDLRIHRLLDEAARRLSTVGRIETAQSAYVRLLELEPQDEAATRGLMRCCIDAGRPADALAAYERLREHLAARYELEPADETRALRERIGGE